MTSIGGELNCFYTQLQIPFLYILISLKFFDKYFLEDELIEVRALKEINCTFLFYTGRHTAFLIRLLYNVFSSLQ
jgi:hypothetical protein